MCVIVMPSNQTAYATTSFDAVVLLSTTVSTNSTTGALVVPGGVGIAGDVNIAGSLVAGSITYSSTSTGTMAITNTPGTTLTVLSTEQAVSVGTGCAVFTGGASIFGNLYVGGTLVAGAITYATTSTGTLDVTSDVPSAFTVQSTTDSTSKTTGGSVLVGGLGVGKKISAGSIRVYDTTQSTTTDSGCGIFPGGIGVAGNIISGGLFNCAQIYCYGNMECAGSGFVAGFDFSLGYGDQSSRGNSGLSRALVKETGPRLVVNYNGDFTAGVQIGGTLNTSGVGSGALYTLGGCAVSLDMVVGGMLNVTGSGSFSGVTSTTFAGSSTTDSTAIGNGPNVFQGGMSVAKNLSLFSLHVYSTTASTSATTGCALFDGGAGFLGSINVAGSVNSPTGTFTTTNSTNINFTGTCAGGAYTGSTVTTTGNITTSATGHFVGGYLDLSEDAAILGDLTSAKITSTDTTDASAFTTAAGLFYGGMVIKKKLMVQETVTNGGFDFIMGNYDQSSRGNTGSSRALVKEVGGKLVINYQGDFFGGTRVDGPLTVNDTTDTSSSLNGAIYTQGGIKLDKNLWCGEKMRSANFGSWLYSTTPTVVNGTANFQQTDVLVQLLGNMWFVEFMLQFDQMNYSVGGYLYFEFESPHRFFASPKTVDVGEWVCHTYASGTLNQVRTSRAYIEQSGPIGLNWIYNITLYFGDLGGNTLPIPQHSSFNWPLDPSVVQEFQDDDPDQTHFMAIHFAFPIRTPVSFNTD